jgi:hypothetical protein
MEETPPSVTIRQFADIFLRGLDGRLLSMWPEPESACSYRAKVMREFLNERRRWLLSRGRRYTVRAEVVEHGDPLDVLECVRRGDKECLFTLSMTFTYPATGEFVDAARFIQSTKNRGKSLRNAFFPLEVRRA